LTLTLPTGFAWSEQTALGAPVSGAWSSSGAPQLSYSDDDQELDIDVSEGSTSPVSVNLTGYVVVNQGTAQYGNVVVTIGGACAYSPSTLTAANYNTYSVSAQMFSTPTITAGTAGTVGEIEVMEGLPGSMVSGRTITMALPANVVWTNCPSIDTSRSTNYGDISVTGSILGTDGKVMQLTFMGNTSGQSVPADLFLENAEVIPAVSFSGQLTATLGGTEGAAGSLTLANVTVSNNDDTLSSLTVNGAQVSNFSPSTLTYNVALPSGTTTAPTVAATTNDPNATAVVNQATSVTGSATVLVTAADKTTAQTYTINFMVSGQAYYIVSGSVNPAGAGSISGSGSYAAGDSVTVTATPNSGYTFANWTVGGNTVSGSVYSFTMPASDVSLVANFTAVATTITLSPTNLPNGTVEAPYPTTTISASGGASPYTFSLMAGSLPPGLDLRRCSIRHPDRRGRLCLHRSGHRCPG
jgi:hypothetical protein